MIVQILDRLFIGDLNYNKDTLKSRGISYVINLCGTKTGLEDYYLHLPDDSSVTLTDISTVLTLLRNKLWYSDAKVFIHCRKGESRAPLIAALWLNRMGMDFNDALRLVEFKHPGTSINEGLLKKVLGLGSYDVQT